MKPDYNMCLHTGTLAMFFAQRGWRFSNDELLTPKSLQYEADLNPRIIDPDPFASYDDNYFKEIDVPNISPNVLIKIDDDIMNIEDEPSSGLNGRLRPRKSAAPSPLAPSKTIRKPESKPAQDRPKRTSTPSKAAANKPDDLANKSDLSTAPQFLCPYCDRKFASKQTASQHARRIHLSNAKLESTVNCLFCNVAEADPNDIIRHMVDNHPNQYFACLDCHTRFMSTLELAEHKLNICEKQKEKPYRSKLRQKVSSSSKKSQKALAVADEKDFSVDSKDFPDGHRFNGVVISCELKPSEVNDENDIEDNITTNLILPPSKSLGTSAVIEKNAVIVLDDIQWNKRMPTNFSFHNTDADQILSRLGVVHRSPRTGETTKKDWFKNAEEPVQKFEKCFDTAFYSKVASNVHENLSKFLDGSFNFNPDPDSIIKTRKSKNSVVINTAEGFPILLAFEQFSRNMFDGYMPRTLAPKHKWKWENEKTLLNLDDIKRDSHVNNCIITLVSSLDIWTQLCMRRKFEEKFSIPPLEKKTEKQNAISKELKQILESRELPSSSRQVVKYIDKPMPSGDSLDFPASLGLKPSAPTYDMQPAVLSGEWVRPRCYVCCACGAQTRDSRGLTSHISTQHPNAQVQYYEIVGELLLNADILKHLYVPPSQMCNRTRPLRGFRECTKCKKSISLEDLHQHMLDCAGDTPAVRRKCRYRPFGVRRRRARLPDNTIRKKIRKDIRSRQNRQKTHMRPRPKIRSEVGDAETIRKMLADLPAKRHRVMVNPMNPILRPRRKLDKQRNKIIMKRRSSEIAKNRRQREMKKVTEGQPSGSNAGDEDNDNKSSKSDDDNKPLKPRIKRVLTHGPRQSESLKRKVALNRAKRRAKMKEHRANDNSAEPPPPVDMASGGPSSSDNRGNQLSIDNTPQRVDVSGGPYGTREHSSRGTRSNNRDSRDDQRSGSSGSPNGDLNNSFGPMQNTPLKHSIARLTAETDAHERALQYHHLYLMQPPDCPEMDTSQHVPSGQQRVFENEAVVTKLDKPPLHFNTPTSMDAYAFQRNKLAKPKKGLNDCIAMLKNKLVDPIPTSKMSHAVQCGGDERLDCETIVANQRAAAALDYQLNMNSRPAEIFSRHQFVPDRYMEYPTEANLIAQNFADLPFHYMPAQRIAFDLPPPDSRVDPRYIKSTRQKQTESNSKKEPTRRRSTRSDKGSTKKQDLNARTSAINYPMNMPAPSKVASGPGRRSSSQNVTANQANVLSKRRASVSYNRSNSTRKHLNEYEAIIAQQRALEFRQQRISPEAHLMEMTHPETYTQTQINKQNQLIAEQMIENYINKKQLAICVDNNYANKMLTAAYAETMYGNRHASVSPGNQYENMHLLVSPGGAYDCNKRPTISPGSKYDNGKNTSVSPGSRYDNSKRVMISPGNRSDNGRQGVVASGPKNDHSQQPSVSPGNRHDSRHMAVSPGNRYEHNKCLAVSPGSRYDGSRQPVISPGSKLDNKKHAAFSPESQHDHNKLASVSPGSDYENMKHAAMNSGTSYDTSRHSNVSSKTSYDTNKQAAISPGSKYDNSKNAAVSPGSQPDVSLSVSPGSKYSSNKPGPVSPGSNYIGKKQAAVAADSNHNSNKHASKPVDTHYVNKKQAASSESNFHKKQFISNTESTFNKPSDANISADSDSLSKVPSTYVETAFISKKAQAVAVENKMANKGQMITDTTFNARVNAVPIIESNSINESQALIHAELNYSKIQSSKEISIAQMQNLETSLSVKPQSATSIESLYGNKSHATTSSENSFMNKNQAIVAEAYVSERVCSENNYINKNLPNILSGGDSSSRKHSVEYYTETEYSIQSIPPTYAAVDNNYQTIPSDIEVPLDLSKSTSKENDVLLKDDDGTYASDSYDNYGTLDLSNKGSEKDNEDVVVDLSVKISSPNLEMCSKLATATNDEIDSATDLSIKIRDVDDTPTDLTVKRKSRTDGFEYDLSRDPNYDDQELIQDLSGKKTPITEHNMSISTMDTDLDIPTDLSGKLQDIPLPLTTVKPSCNVATDNASDINTLDLPVASAGNRDQTKDNRPGKVTQMLPQNSLLSSEISQGKDRVEENAYEDTVQRVSFTPSVSFDISVQKSQYHVQTSATTSNKLSEFDETPKTSKDSSSVHLTSACITSVDDTAFVNNDSPPVTAIISGNVTQNLISTTPAGPMPLYTLSNTIMPLAMSKFESTTPVYTLANACISMAKVEPTNIAPLSDAILSIPSTTIVSVAPVYTLTDTTVNPTINYLHVHNKSMTDLSLPLANPTSSNIIPVDTEPNYNAEKQNIYISSSSPPAAPTPGEEPLKKTDSTTYDELDPETAKKIALLPKELVEILGTMPVDHRNQLLNVLPQYVSTTIPTQNDESDISAPSLVNRAVSPTRISEFDIKPSLGYSPVSSSQLVRPLSEMVPGVEKLDETKSFPLYHSAIGPKPVDGGVSKCEPPELPKVYEIDGNTVIDLTEDDVPINAQTPKIKEDLNKTPIKPNEPIIEPPLNKSNKQKVNDQTASLRAVRIKAPSERNKSVSTDNTLAKKPSIELIQSNVEVVDDKDITTDLDKTLAIQQAEISSTQHNTTIAGNCKYPLAISPSSTEYSGDESSKPVSQQSPIPTIVVTEKITEKKYDKLVPKPGMVSSSISTSDVDNVVAINVSKDSEENKSAILEPASKKSLVSVENVSSEVNLTPNNDELSVAPSLENEDSDDDISLAAIVKQKQRDLVKSGNITKDNLQDKKLQEINDTKKKKKDKKVKKVANKMQNVEGLSSSNVSNDTRADTKSGLESRDDNKKDASEDTDLVSEVNIDHEEVTKHSKKKAKKVRRFADTSSVVEKQQEVKVSDESEKDINKENDSTSEVINNKMVNEENTSNLDVINQTCNIDTLHEDKALVVNDPQESSKPTIKPKIMKEIVVDPIVKISKCDEKLTAYSAKASKLKEKKKKLDFFKVDQEQPAPDDNRKKCASDEFDPKLDRVSTLVSQRLTGGIESHYEVLPRSGRENDIFLNIADGKKNKKSARSKKSRNEDVDKVELVVDSSENERNILEIKQNIITPLRRSRRGKSLYLENISLEPESAALDEVILEQKAPLTKKQLIFSKLLLDEENPKPSAHSTPEKSDFNNSEADESTINKTAIIQEISGIDNVEELCPEKTKGTKRRISAQFSKKTKKKKSIDETNAANEISNIDQLQTEDFIEENLNANSEAELDLNKSKESTGVSSDINDSDKNGDQLQELTSSKDNDEKHVLSTEKRKNSNQISFDLSQSSKPKKCKLNKGDKKLGIAVDIENNFSESVNTVPIATSETKTACYNLPLPARRARSKSVVVKSSTYDPYDIDLEDMLEQNEMFKRKEKSTDITKNKNKSSNQAAKDTNKNLKEIRKDHRRKDTPPDQNVMDDSNNDYNKSTVCDSDDSSKSDVPLQKYVEEKEKKIQEVEANLFKEKDSKTHADKPKVVENKDTKSSPSTNTLQNDTQAQAEEELRSEQFMESFGFFSERKPRKSNLLATKKISETIHITNESDDMYFGFKERTGKKSGNSESKKPTDSETKNQPQPSTSKRAAPKRGGRKTKKAATKIMPCYCGVCKKEFRRPDNYLRHQMSLLHISKLSDAELKVKTEPIHEEPNYLIAYKQYISRLKKLTDLLAKKKKKFPKAAAKIVLPTLEEVLADVNKAVRDQQRCARGLSRDEALFLDCCELLRESHKFGGRGRFGMSGLDILEKALNDLDANEDMSDDGDCDSITAQNILESEEVRNLENDLISGLKEAANATRNANIEYQHSLNEFAAPQVVQMVEQEQQETGVAEQELPENRAMREPHDMIPEEAKPEEFSEQFSSPNAAESHYDNLDEFDAPAKPTPVRVKKHFEVKEKMYPDILIEDIDMFEDKFDKIKRKCRSQAAAAKQPQPIVDPTISHKGRKKSEKKKGKRSSKKARHQSTHVPTKGALKGFDGIRVSIPTSDINLAAIVPVSESSPKKKKKSSSKKKRDKRDSESSGKYDSDHRAKDSSSKKVDVYEFMDNEDAELFEFRPSTLMERFKSISNNNKDAPSTSKFHPAVEENSSQDSASDGDDFVYMSDDYVASDDETENSLMSCELGNVKIGSDAKKNSPQKRKDVVEKNAVMGKIFKHNAVRAEKKVVVPKETEKPKANLDQLFDSLLEEEPNSSTLNSEETYLREEDFTTAKKYNQSSTKSNTPEKALDQTSDSDVFAYPCKSGSASPSKNDSAQPTTLTKRRSSSPTKAYSTSTKKHSLSIKNYDSREVDYGQTTSKKYDSSKDSMDYETNTSKKYYNQMPKDCKKSLPKSYDLQKEDEDSNKHYDGKTKKRNDSSSSKNDDELTNSYEDDLITTKNRADEGISTSYDYNAELYDQSLAEDEAGVARQRARRKCTVGKQNILAETWSSESEPDGGPPRPNSAESDISGVSRKKKGRKKEGQQAGGRRGNNRQVAFKKQDAESRVSSSSRISSGAPSGGTAEVDDPGEGTSGMCSASAGGAGSGPCASSAADSAAAAAAAAAAMPAPATSAAAGPTNVKGRPRGVAYYWSSEGDDEQEHLQQHGWIVGDSHKKLVTMLAHAKGRKRNNDDKRHLVE